MSISTACTRRSRRSEGFASIEMLVAFTIVATGIAFASGLMIAAKSHGRRQEKEIEATHTGRAALDSILRELRLSGACLPDTGEFIALEAVDDAESDAIVTRYGLTTEQLSCVQTTITENEDQGSTVLQVADTADFAPEMTVYLRNTNGGGAYYTLVDVDADHQTLTIDRPLLGAFPATSGVYAIDERRFFLDTEPEAPHLMFQVGGNPPQPFAIGIERLDIYYETAMGTTTAAPSSHAEWRSVRQVHISLTARSSSAGIDGQYFRRTFNVTVQPRNLIQG